MSSTRSPQQQRYRQSTAGSWSYGLTLFAAVVLITVGAFQALSGLSAILDDKVFVKGISFVYEFDLTAWGWIHLLLGLLAIGAGIGLLRDQNWARLTGIALAVLSAVANFMFVPYYPVWSLLIIAFDVAVIWALSAAMQNG